MKWGFKSDKPNCVFEASLVPTEAVETFSYAENGYLAALERWAVPARDRARLWKAPSFNPRCVVTSRRDPSHCSSPLATSPRRE